MSPEVKDGIRLRFRSAVTERMNTGCGGDKFNSQTQNMFNLLGRKNLLVGKYDIGFKLIQFAIKLFRRKRGVLSGPLSG